MKEFAKRVMNSIGTSAQGAAARPPRPIARMGAPTKLASSTSIEAPVRRGT